MTITFHCEHCNKKIEAPDTAGGRWGKCPSCHNKIYVPSLETDDELTLAPIDESEEEKKKHMMAETYKLSQDILLERDAPDTPDKKKPAVTRPIPQFQSDEKQVTKNIIAYMRYMVNGELEKAQQVSELIAASGNNAIEELDKIALSDIPEPELADIPPQVLSGLIRQLRAQIF